MIYTIDLIDEVTVKSILEFYKFCSFSDGSVSGSSDKTVKYNEEIDDKIHLDSLTEYTDKAFKRCEQFSYMFTPRATTLPKFLRYTEGMHYDYHNDFYLINQVRTDWSCTCFLSSPDDYEGGELVLNVGNKEVEYKLNPGQVLVYPTGIYHKVNKVTSGERNVVVFWMESIIQDSRMRNILAEYSQLMMNRKNEICDYHSDFERIRYQIIREYGQL